MMANNFKISIHRNSDNLHMKLVGDFDGTSAHLLINALKAKMRRASKVFIHTECLENIYPFGSGTFLSNLDFVNGNSVTLVFTGDKARQLAPENNKQDCIIC
ncbi:MAG: hypothetical protein JRJ20_11035 [Deltaproteobacteria bacterium]|nr:hypothetical protein [Deltaproteobacteria bacterium]